MDRTVEPLAFGDFQVLRRPPARCMKGLPVRTTGYQGYVRVYGTCTTKCTSTMGQDSLVAELVRSELQYFTGKFSGLWAGNQI